MTMKDEDEPDSRILAEAAANVHDNLANQQDGNDLWGKQGGQYYTGATTPPPTPPPTTSAPTSSPTGRPTIAGRVHVLRGVTWYDRNANGKRDSNVEAGEYGDDVEYSHGVGGVMMQVIECDGETGLEFTPAAGETIQRSAATTAGFNVNYRPQVVPTSGDNGKYNIRLNKANQYYYVKVTAPNGYLITSGVCNDDEEGWECGAITDSEGNLLGDGRRSARRLQEGQGMDQDMLTRDEDEPLIVATAEEAALGIPFGRSTSCVFMDHDGEVQAPLNFGIMRLGDTQEVATHVALVLEFDDDEALTSRRSLKEVLEDAKVLDESYEDGGFVTTRYLLGERDKAAIGTVTAEVLAATLDGRLAKSGVELDSVNPREVMLSKTKNPANSEESSSSGNQLAVAMEIRGHYSPPPELDFDYIVQDSINRDTATIRRGLRDYNSNCRDQTTNIQGGLERDDYKETVSNAGKSRVSGARPAKPSDISAPNSGLKTFSTACSSNFLVPDYFEKSLKEIEARDLSEVGFADRDMSARSSDEERAGGLKPWAMGPVAGLAGLIVLLAGALVFRRAIGPRRVDGYSDAIGTKDVDKAEMRRFGEAGGDMDDGSVDSAFYSDSEEEETEKERKMRRKRKEKAADDDQKGGKGRSSTREARASRKARGGKSSRKVGGARDTDKKLAVSVGSDDTESLGKSDKSSLMNSHDDLLKKKIRGDGDDRKRGATKDRGERRRASAPSSYGKRRSSGNGDQDSFDRRHSSSSRREERRGRNKRSGGDNARTIV
mmetsp:Transcript_33334/g.80621  ORF Transcript_33334/g.80621 Transcript_33334/m.80621 type:complete len:774 (-) Transcript_33334:271-2592(-)